MTDEKTEDKKTEKGKLPGDHGQFGENNATEEYKPLEDHPTPGEPGDQGAKQTDAGERS